MLTTILLYAGIFLGGIVAGLKVIAPRTSNKLDDKALIYGQDAVKFLEALGVSVPKDVAVQAVAATKG